MGIRAADNSVGAVLAAYREQLAPLYEEGEARAIARAVFRERLGWDAAQVEVRRADPLHESDLLKVYLPLKRLREGVPLQHVLGKVRFDGMELSVSPDALIPRPETEELVALIAAQERDPRRIVDVGTGSGCIALALKRRFPQARVAGIDASPAALGLARRNAQALGVEVELIQGDALAPSFSLPEGADLVVSNPPYIPVEEAATLDAHVRGHEPAMALFAPAGDPLAFYRAIGRAACARLRPGASLWFEAHARHADRACSALRAMGFRQAETLRDLSGHQRFIRCTA